jgi:AbrB family looped-hinge helix DNA binding protein
LNKLRFIDIIFSMMGVLCMISDRTQITGRGQIQLPAKIRRAMGAEIGDEILLRQKENGEIVVELLKKKKLCELAGILQAKRPFAGVDDEEEQTRIRVAEKTGKYEQTE